MVSVTEQRPRGVSLRPLRGLLPFMLRYPKMLVGAFVALVTAAMAALIMPIAVRYMIDNGFAATDTTVIDIYFLALLGVAVVLGIASAVRFYCFTWLGERVTNDLRYQVYTHILDLSSWFFEKTSTGELVSRLTADTTLIRTILDTSISIALRNGFLFAGSLMMLAVTSPSLSLYVGACIPLVVLPILLSGRLVRRRARTSQDKLAEASALITESIPAMQLLQAFTHEKEHARALEQRLEASFRAAKGRIVARAYLTALAIILVFIGIVAVLWLGAQQMLTGQISAGVLGQFVLYALLCAGSMGALAEVWGDMQLAAGATERLTEILALDADIAVPKNPAALPNPVRGHIVLHDVCFAYPGRSQHMALNHISLDIRPGENCALVGESGAGKSTMFQLLLRFYDVTSGHIMLDGVRLGQLHPRVLRSAMAIVPQDTLLFSGSVRDNILFGRPEASEVDVQAAADAALAHDFIKQLPHGYDTQLGERGVNLSGGQRQRLAIARAILRDAPVLLLDEATNALDAQSESMVQQALQHLMRRRTSVVIAHRLATVCKAQRIIMLKAGRILASGTHDSLLANSADYQELVRLQFSSPATNAA